MQSNPMLEEAWRIRNLEYLIQVFTHQTDAANHLLARARML
jgi:hypothetical protein